MGVPEEKYMEKGQIGSSPAGSDSALKKEATNWYEKVKASDENLPGKGFNHSETSDRMSGNWI